MKLLFTNILYVKVYVNKFSVKNVSNNGMWADASPDQAFSTERLLVGKFSAAEPVLSRLIKEALPKTWLKKRPVVVIQPMEKIEGGLSEVETRIFKELAFGAGAIKVELHLGNELTDEAVTALINNG